MATKTVCDGCGVELDARDGYRIDASYRAKDGAKVPLSRDYCGECDKAMREWISSDAIRRRVRGVA